MSDPETIHIACEADAAYLPHTAAMLHSLWWHERKARFVVHFLHEPELKPRMMKRFERLTRRLGMQLNWIAVPNELLEGLEAGDRFPRVLWYRIFMPQLLSELSKVLYIDGDVIAMDSVRPLWQTQLGENIFAAVTNAVPDYYAHRAGELGLPGPEYYFNAGIALWNLDLMREQNFTRAVVDYWQAHRAECLWLEQDVVNALYHRQRLALHPRWNCQNGIYYDSWGVRLFAAEDIHQAVDSPGLVHFEGGAWAKPWHLLSPHPLRKQYYFHRRRTPWPWVTPDGLNLRNLLQKLLPDDWFARLRQARRKWASR